VKITLGEDFPRILRTRALGDRTARYFGPFANAKSVDQSLDLLQKLFPYRTCKLTILAADDGRGRTVPPSALPGGRPCLLFHLKRCTAPCVGNTTKDEYRATIDKSVLFLDGRYEPLARATRREMESAAEALEFERAAALRDRLTAIDRTLDRQEVHAYKGDDFDVLAASIDEGDAVVQVFRVRDGTIVGRDHFALEGSEGAGPPEVVASFLRQHYSAATMLPPEIVTPTALPEAAALETFLTERRAGPVRLHVPQRGKKRHLAENAERNAKEALDQERVRWLADRGKTEVALRELQEALGLEGPPKRIECYDVSHVQGTSVVSSMIVFEDGRPAKSQYRRFRARISDRNDDFANMRETLKRRFARSFVGGTGGDGEAPAARTSWPLPDLIILDGGKGQLSAGLEALAEAGRLQIPIAALAKEREELFVPNRAEPIVLPRTAQGLYLVQRIRDEAHRFAVTYHQKVRSRRAVRSILDDIAGVGPARKRALLRKFGSVRGMQGAPVEDLAAVGGVGQALAERIKQALTS
jgi:excinuclease ABC subunit C